MTAPFITTEDARDIIRGLILSDPVIRQALAERDQRIAARIADAVIAARTIDQADQTPETVATIRDYITAPMEAR